LLGDDPRRRLEGDLRRFRDALKSGGAADASVAQPPERAASDQPVPTTH
jgi:hypothetical protein